MDERSGELARTGPITACEAERFKLAVEFMRTRFRTASLNDVAEHIGYSPHHFHRRFSLWAGRTPKQIMTELQIDLARKLLVETTTPLPEIAEQCGFASQSHFTDRFKRMMGDAPCRWLLNQHRGGNNATSSEAA